MDLIAPATGVFIDERELRPGVDYLVSPGAELKFGEDLARACLRVGSITPDFGSHQASMQRGACLFAGKVSDGQETLRVEFDEPETGSAAGLDMVMKVPHARH